MIALLNETVDKKILWNEIEQNKAYFAEETVFDGGFRQKGIISSNIRFEEYEPSALEYVSKINQRN